MVNKNLKIYFKYDYQGVTLHFNTQYGVTNAKKIDSASELILNKIKIDKQKRVFVTNAGYGAFGVPLAKLHPKVQFDLTDRDFVNVSLIKENAQSNECSNAVAYLSDGLEQARSQNYDVIILNLNQQYGKEWFENFLERSKILLTKDGKLIVLIHKSLKEFVKRLVEEKFGQYEKIYHDNNYYLLSN